MAIKTNQQKKLNRILGVEISENDIIATEIIFTKNSINLSRGFRLPITVFQDINKTIKLFKQNLKVLNIKTKECAFGFSMQYFKLLPVPVPVTIPEEEIGSIVVQEANIDVENEIATWVYLRNTQRQDVDGVNRIDVLGLSIQRQISNIANQICKECGLKLVSLTPSFLGLPAFLSSTPSNNLIGTLWVSQIRSEFIVWSGQEPIYEHLFLTHQISNQIFESVNYIQTQLPGTQVSAIFTSGPFAKETNLSQLPFNIQPFVLPTNLVDTGKVLQQISLTEIITSLGIAFSASNCFSYIAPNLLNQIKETKSSGIKNIFKDFSKAQTDKTKSIKLPFSFTPKSIDPHLVKFIAASVFIILISVLSGLFIQNGLTPNVEANQGTSTNRLNLAQLQLSKLLNIEKTNKVLNLKADYFSELIDKRKPWSKIVREVGDMTPKGLWIDRIQVKNNDIDVFGRALNIDAVASFSINLNYTAKLLGNAQIIALRKSEEDGIEIVEYQVNVKTKNNQDQIAAKESENKVIKSSPKI